MLPLFVGCLRCQATNVISGTKYPTANLYLHEMLKVKLTLDQQTFEEESEMRTMLKYMKTKFDKYWKVSWLDLCIPVVLDPQFKLNYLEFRFDLEFGNEAIGMITKIKNVIQRLFNEYLKLNGNGSDPMSQGVDVEMVATDHDPILWLLGTDMLQLEPNLEVRLLWNWSHTCQRYQFVEVISSISSHGGK